MVNTLINKNSKLLSISTNKQVQSILTHLYIVKLYPYIEVSLQKRNKRDYPHKSYYKYIEPGTILYIAKQKLCSNNYNGQTYKYCIHDIFLTEEDAKEYINNYKCRKNIWIESSVIIETILQPK